MAKAKYDYEKMWHDYVHDRLDDNSPLTITDVANRNQLPGCKVETLRANLSRHARHKHWEDRRATIWQEEGYWPPGESPEELAAADPEPEDEGPVLIVGENQKCPHCEKPIMVTDNDLSETFLSFKRLKKRIDDEIEHDTTGQNLAQLSTASKNLAVEIQKNLALQDSRRTDRSTAVMDADETDELIRVANIVLECIVMAPADDPRIIELKRRTEEVVR